MADGGYRSPTPLGRSARSKAEHISPPHLPSRRGDGAGTPSGQPPIVRIVLLSTMRSTKLPGAREGVINRLASDSFRMKGWCVVLVAALFFLLAREGRIEFIVIALVPVIAFWGLGAYFLWQDRLFRVLYDYVRALEEDEIDFSMDVGLLKKNSVRDWLGVTFSQTLLFFYGAKVARFRSQA